MALLCAFNEQPDPSHVHAWQAAQVAYNLHTAVVDVACSGQWGLWLNGQSRSCMLTMLHEQV